MRWMVGPGSALELAPPGNLQVGELTRYLAPMMRCSGSTSPARLWRALLQAFPLCHNACQAAHAQR